MRIVMTLLAVAGNFAATLALMLALSTVGSVGLSTSAAAKPVCDPRHYYCFPCSPSVITTGCAKGCCGGLAPDSRKPE